jgi:hypothetical protein
MYTKPTAPRSIGGVLDATFSLWLPALKRAWLLILIPQLASFVLAIPQLSSLASTAGAGGLPLFSATTITSQLLSILVGLITLVFYSAMIARIDDVASQGSMSLGQSLSVGLRYWGRAFLMVLIMMVFMIPVLVPLGLATASIQGGTLPTSPLSAGISLLATIYVFVLLFLFGRAFLAYVVLVLEDARAWASIRRSWNLTRGHWWRCAAIFTVLAIVSYVVFIVAGLAIGALGIKIGWRATGILDFKVLLATQLLSMAVGVVFSPLFVAGALAIYYDLKLRKEGGDLAGRVEALASNKP